MKKLILLLVTSISFQFLFAQNIGIGTNTPDATAKVEIASDNSGILIPRLTTAQRNAIAGPARGLLVYSLSDSSFWFYDDIWKKLMTVTDAWSMRGNSGANNPVIGTTNGYPLRFRVGNLHGGEIGYSNSNVALGLNALTTNMNTSGSSNTAIGADALNLNTTGSNNTAIGRVVMIKNTTGSDNTALGIGASYMNEAGYGNVAIGESALYNNNGGYWNTVIGKSAMNMATASYLNTAIGANTSISNSTIMNSVALGYNTTVNASNKVRIGGTGITVIEGQVAFSTPSDGRFKTNVSEDIKGLDFILKLRPVSYNFQTKKYDAFLKQDLPVNAEADKVDLTETEQVIHSGFIAQEVVEAAKQSGYNFNGVIVPKTEKGTYGIAYSQFVIPLVKAVQEQQVVIETLRLQQAETQKQIDELKAAIEALQKKN